MEKRTKIICTIGPASASQAVLEKMIRAGMNVARLNFSHGNYTDHRALIRHLRAASKKVGQPVAILQDLQGPRIRIGVMPKAGVVIKPGDEVVVVPAGANQRFPHHLKVLPTQYPELAGQVKVGNKIYREL
ncbi:MAG: pyruvate kinase [Patescibacteria group bacterium]